jgi:hypothetical protein
MPCMHGMTYYNEHALWPKVVDMTSQQTGASGKKSDSNNRRQNSILGCM